jgi:hypothetical protein
MDLFLSLCIGVALSAACGFRVFVPLLITSIAAHSGHLHLAQKFAWVGSTPALVTFSIATALEIAAYYVPWLDNMLDTVSTPASVVAGTILTASMISDMDPYMRWTLAVVAGGGAAGLVQTGTVLLRAGSLAGTGGLANPILATAELFGSFTTAILAIVAPVIAALLVLGVAGFAGYKIVRRKGRPAPPRIATS